MVTNRWHHEAIFRGQESMRCLSKLKVVICGAGALGSNLAVNLVRQGVTGLTIIDHDRIEPHNVGTQVYSLDDIGALKAEMLRNLIFRDIGEEISAVPRRLEPRNAAKLLGGHDLVVDVFDNFESRDIVSRWCRSNDAPCLHAGVNDQYGEIRWNENYRVPSDQGGNVCDYPLARNLIMLLTSLASEVIVRFALTGARLNLSVTLADLSINREQP